MKIVIKFLVILLSLFVTVSCANAAPFYMGLGVGFAEYEEISETIDSPPPDQVGQIGSFSLLKPGQSFTDDANSLEIYGGYRFNKYLSIEIGYSQFEKMKKSYEVKDVASAIANHLPTNDVVENELRSGSINMNIGYPILDKFGVYAVLGYSYFDIDSESHGLGRGDRSYSDEGVLYGLGGRFFFNDKYFARLQWTRSEADEFDLDLIRISIERNFDLF